MRDLNVGDKVKIKSKKWYDKNKDLYGTIHISPGFIDEMSSLCGCVVTILYKRYNNHFDKYTYMVEGSIYAWTEEFFESVHNQD